MSHVVVTVVQEGANPFEFAVASEVFGLPRPEINADWYDFRLCAPGREITVSGGWQLRTEYDLEVIAEADSVVVPNGCCNLACQNNEAVLAALQKAHDRGARLISFCTGVFALAEAGILDGRRATTHWMYTDDFRMWFPKVKWDENVLYVDDGDVLTSAGTAAAVDLSLHIVRQDYGADVARNVARRMLVAPHRSGSQAQYIEPPHEPRVRDDSISATLVWLQENLDQQIAVADMAAHAAMSKRTFNRRFKEATGTTPHNWLTTLRLHRAQALLETSDMQVDLVADRAGFGTSANLRQHFKREFSVTPSRYRESFQDAA